MSGRKRAILYAAIGIALLLCVSLPAIGLAALGVTHFGRGRSAMTATASAQTPIPSPSASSTPAPLCGGPPAMFILLIGSDSRPDSYAAGLADSVHIVRADFVTPRLQFLAFPRDLYVEIPEIASHGGITHGKLNQAYLYGNSAFGYYGGAGQGPGLLSLTMEHNFGAVIDHYVAVNLRTFVRIVDGIGGLDINLPYTIDGRAARSKDPDRYFPAGPLHLDGYRTMLLARLRPNGDLERYNVQGLILKALAAKMLTPANLGQMPQLVETFYGSVQTDMTADDIRKLLCLASKLDAAKVEPLAFPEDIFTGTRINDPVLGYTFVWQVDFGLLRIYVQRFTSATWPAEPIATATPPTITP